MAMGTNILAILVFVSIAFQFVGPQVGIPTQSLATDLVFGGSSAGNTFTAQTWIAYLIAGAVIGGLASLGASVLTGTFSFPNPYTIFAAALAGMLATVVVVPAQLFSQFPSPIKEFAIGGFGFFFVLAAIVWYKGGGEL